MKKLLLSTVLVFVALFGYSQAKVELGLKGGLNLASVNTKDPLASYSSLTSYHAGLYALIKAGNIGIQPEILYSTQGTQVSFQSVSGDFKQQFTYLNIPVMLKLYTVAGINFQVGPQFGMLMSVDGKFKDSNGNVTTISKSSYKNSDVSGAVGVGWDAPFGLNFTARYIMGFSNVNSSSSNDQKNRTFQVSLGYRLFKVGK